MFCVYTEVIAQDDTVTSLIFSFPLCLRLTSPNYAFMKAAFTVTKKSYNKCNMLNNSAEGNTNHTN